MKMQKNKKFSNLESFFSPRLPGFSFPFPFLTFNLHLSVECQKRNQGVPQKKGIDRFLMKKGAREKCRCFSRMVPPNSNPFCFTKKISKCPSFLRSQKYPCILSQMNLRMVNPRVFVSPDFACKVLFLKLN